MFSQPIEKSDMFTIKTKIIIKLNSRVLKNFKKLII